MKFYHVRTGLEGDISLYNTLVGLFLSLCVFKNKKMCTFWNLQFLFGFFSQALHNTHLLATYAAIDRRVKILCYVMKVFAKVNVLYRLVTKTSLSVLAIVLFNIKCCFHFHYRCVTLEMLHVVASHHMPTPSWCCSSFSRETHQLSLCCKRYRWLFERRANFILFTNKLHIDVCWFGYASVVLNAFIP